MNPYTYFVLNIQKLAMPGVNPYGHCTLLLPTLTVLYEVVHASCKVDTLNCRRYISISCLLASYPPTCYCLLFIHSAFRSPGMRSDATSKARNLLKALWDWSQHLECAHSVVCIAKNTSTTKSTMIPCFCLPSYFSHVNPCVDPCMRVTLQCISSLNLPFDPNKDTGVISIAESVALR